MLPADWQKVKEAFQAAVEADPDRLPSLLEDFRASEPTLFDELDSLLRHRQETGSLFPQSPSLHHLLDDESQRWVGRSIGPYSVVSVLGEGGMGAVFQAIRIDDHYLKNVAIKIVRSAYTSGPYLRRFKSERQILASLDHPNIAHLLDGGATEEGLPYLVMEFVEGSPIDEYCDQRRLTIAQRLDLFLKVCSAVEYAHHKLVIHRDLKPANILVTEDGVPKLLDFGIAKLVDPELYLQTDAPDATIARAMTPEYASPEQIRGDRITTGSDVYALGVILYRLLAGRPPYILSPSHPAVWSRVVLEVEPERPSIVTSKAGEVTNARGETRAGTPDEIAHLRSSRPAALRRELSGDLDNILLMALRKDPARRYASVEQLASDIRRSLEGMPVHARPDTIVYRTQKFARRHRVPLFAVAIVLLSLTAGIFVSMRQARIAEQQRRLAEHRFNDIQTVAHDLIFDIHDSIQPLAGATSARKMVVQAALRYLDTLSKDSPGNLALEKEIATAYEKIGDVQGGIGAANLGDTAGALASYTRALSIRTSILAASSGSVDARRGLSHVYLRMGGILEEMGRYQEALAYHQQHIELSRRLASESPRDARVQSDLASAYDGIGGTYVSLARWDDALSSYQASAEIYRALAAMPQRSSVYRRDWALERKKVGGIYEFRGDYARALADYRFALGVDEELAARNPQDASAQRDVSIDRSSLGDVILKQGDAPTAIQHYRKALALDRALAAADPKDASSQYYLVYDSYRLGDALVKNASLREATALYRQALARAQKNATSDRGNLYLQSELARVYSKLADAHYTLARSGKLADTEKKQWLAAASDSYRKSLAIWSALRERGALHGQDLEEPGKVAENLRNCALEISRLS